MSQEQPSLPPSAPVPPAVPPAKKRGLAFPIVVIVLALAALIGLELIESVVERETLEIAGVNRHLPS